MKFQLQFECDNAAFGESDYERTAEITLILRTVIRKVEAGFHSGNTYDSNGNRVGSFSITTTTKEK